MIFFQGTLGNQMGLLLEPITTDLGIARTLFGTMMSLATLVNLLCSLSFSKFLTILGIKKMTIIGALSAVLYCVLLVLAGRMSGSIVVIILVLAHLVLGICFSWSGAMTVSILINNWFAKRASTMISIVSAFAGLTGTIAAPLITTWITNDGWSASILYRGIPVVITFILFFFIIRATPGVNDKRIWDDGNEDTSSDLPAEENQAGMTLEEARKSKKFWFGIVTSFGVGVILYPASVICLPALAADLGYAANSGTVMSVLFASSLVTTLVIGGLVEKLGCRKALIPPLVLTIISMIMFSLKSLSLTMLYASTVLMGIGYTLINVAVPFMTAEAFGIKDFGRIHSFLFSAMVLGMVAGSPLFNAFYDMSGSYSIAYIVGAVACAVMIFTLIITTGKSTTRKRG